MKRLWMGTLAIALGLTVHHVNAQEMQWRPVLTPADSSARASNAESQTGLPSLAGSSAAPANIGVILRAPVPLPPSSGAPIVQASGTNPDGPPAFRIVRAQSPEEFNGPAPVGALPPPPPPPPPGAVADGSIDEKFNCAVKVNSSGGPGFWDQTRDGIAGVPQAFGNMFSGGGRNLLQSDHCFDGFISPVSNPFYFLDPRSLTEVKPLLIYQKMPSTNAAMQGGSVWFYGLQGSVAITDMFSVVVPKLGAITLDSHNPAIGSHTGMAEFSLGPQFTFYRNEQSKTLIAAGLLFDLAIGSGDVYQNTGDLSLVPYISYGQGFGKSNYGSFNFLTTNGYSAAIDSSRTDFFFSSLHLDYDVYNLNKIFPLVELNWFHYTTNGNSQQFFGFEGRDLINFGSGGVAGHNELSMALGARYKFCEWLQTGLVFEFPLINTSDIMSYRIGFDLIFKY